MSPRQQIDTAPIGSVYTPQHKPPALRRRLSPSSILLGLFGAAIAIVLYIGNILAVDQLLRELGELENRHRQLLAHQELLRSAINRLSGLERIQELAEQRLALRTPQAPPIWITVDTSRINALEQAATTE
jgi:hypothetical protein